MQEQKQAILAAVDSLISEHDRWENDPTAPAVPTQAIDDAVETCIQVAGSGDVPGECRLLVSHLMTFCERWLEYRGGDWAKDGRPNPGVWSAFNQVRHVRTSDTNRHVRRVETITRLREQKCSDLQIAKAYGAKNSVTDQWEGPFFHNGMVQNDLIEKQYQHEKGNGEPFLSADWIPPVNEQIARDQSDKVTRKVKELAERSSPGPRDKGTPEELAQGGGFPHQVKKAFGLSDDEIVELYTRLGKSELLDPTLRERLLESPAAETAEPAAASEETDDDALSQLVCEIHDANESLDAAGIAREVAAQLGVKITGRKVAKILKSQKQEAAA